MDRMTLGGDGKSSCQEDGSGSDEEGDDEEDVVSDTDADSTVHSTPRRPLTETYSYLRTYLLTNSSESVDARYSSKPHGGEGSSAKAAAAASDSDKVAVTAEEEDNRPQPVTRAEFLAMTTAKATVQPGEMLVAPELLPSEFPDK